MRSTGLSVGPKTMNRRTFLNLGCATLFSGTVMSGVGTAYATVIEPRWIEVTRLDINLPRWPTALTHLTIAQLSDLPPGGVRGCRQYTPRCRDH
jgi:hypothetical protein